jgi:hypothetical protein
MHAREYVHGEVLGHSGIRPAVRRGSSRAELVVLGYRSRRDGGGCEAVGWSLGDGAVVCTGEDSAGPVAGLDDRAPGVVPSRATGKRPELVAGTSSVLRAVPRGWDAVGGESFPVNRQHWAVLPGRRAFRGGVDWPPVGMFSAPGAAKGLRTDSAHEAGVTYWDCFWQAGWCQLGDGEDA